MCALLAVMLVGGEAVAQSEQRALLPAVVNATPRGDVSSYIVGDDVYVPKPFFSNFALPLTSAKTRTFDGDVYVSLKSLAPALTFNIDPVELNLAITLDPRYLGKSTVTLGRGSAIEDRGGDPSLFFNYSLTGQPRHTPNVFTEFGANRGNRLFYTGVGRTPDNGFLRGLTYFHVDTPANLRRWTFGDAFVGNDILGGSVDIGGVTLSREYSLQPYLIRSPSLDVSGTALTPSTVEVYVNGQLTNRIAVQPGQFTLHDLPVTGGLGDTRLVIRDAFGRETVQENSFYYSTTVLRKGFSDYVFSAGAVRHDLSRSFAYDGAGTLMQYRRGVTDRVTLGGRLEADRHIASGGPRATFSTAFGDFDAGFGASRDSQSHASGTAESFAYRFNAPRFSFGGNAVNRSANYATLSVPASADRALHDWSVFAAATAARVSFGVLVNRTDLRSGEHLRRAAIQTTAPLARWGNFFASVATVESNGKREPEVLVGLTLSIGAGTAADVLAERTQGRDGVRAEVRKPLTMANGLGYAIQTDSILNTRLAQLDYQTSFGRYQITADPRNTDQSSYLIAGGVVAMGHDLLPSRPVDNSYALARVGVPGVKVFASNQEVGRTTSNGDLLIPNLLPHYLNVLRINDKDVPIEYEISGTEVTVVPPSRGGIVANFPVRKVRGYSGTMQFMIIGRPFVPSLGELQIKGANDTLTLSLGRNGEFYTEELGPGTYAARLLIGKVHCDVRLVLPSTDQPVTNLGVIPCAP